MGTKFAPTYATLVLGFLDEKLYLQADKFLKTVFARCLKPTWKIFWVTALSSGKNPDKI